MTYSAGNLKWGEPTLGQPSGQITWSADVFDDLLIANGTSEPQFSDALQAAFDAWESVASVDFQMVSTGADVNLFVNDIGGAAGEAYYTYVDRGTIDVIQGGTISFSSDLVWSPYGDDDGVDFYAVALHEIGHMIGLNHVSDRTEIMNPVIYADDLGDGDIAGAQFLYGRDPGDSASEAPNDGSGGGGISAETGGGDGGGGGGMLGMLAALLALVFGIFSGGGAIAAAGQLPDEDDDGDDDDRGTGEVFTSEPELLFLPLIFVEEGNMAQLDAEDEDEDDWLI
ncbi:matrixin family metalloprotease [Silicimonas algicola]|uniref:Matrixin n=1 Tax=Silicimonas algicola TaxID=1826607 RepID=A0A316GNW9_9RHOB|nr:matrixin family metalloprotease [Silicimonas algicola]AZQ65685.1 matrixin family metalloprotease [Silicimonas algicola]PWK56627.1 matrixin [Silicimonas algicola]